MDSIKSFFDSFKEFVWDIIGYILPGSYLLILLSTCIDESYFVHSKIKLGDSNSNELLFVIIAYLLGYVVYGFSFLKEKAFGKKSYMKKIEAKVFTNNAVKWAKAILDTKFNTTNIQEDFSNASLRELRNIIMSFIPEADQKIYTFTFRSDVSNNVANVSLVIGSTGLIFTIISFFSSFVFFNISSSYIILYISLIGVYFLLRETRDRFYAIAMSIPFSIFTAKNLKNES